MNKEQYSTEIIKKLLSFDVNKWEDYTNGYTIIINGIQASIHMNVQGGWFIVGGLTITISEADAPEFIKLFNLIKENIKSKSVEKELKHYKKVHQLVCQ